MFTAAALTLVLSVIAAAFLHGSGVEIMQIRSVGGKTLEEAYYARLGGVYTGFAIMSVAFGVFAAALLSSFGYKTLKG